MRPQHPLTGTQTFGGFILRIPAANFLSKPVGSGQLSEGSNAQLGQMAVKSDGRLEDGFIQGSEKLTGLSDFEVRKFISQAPQLGVESLQQAGTQETKSSINAKIDVTGFDSCLPEELQYTNPQEKAAKGLGEWGEPVPQSRQDQAWTRCNEQQGLIAASNVGSASVEPSYSSGEPFISIVEPTYSSVEHSTCLDGFLARILKA